MKLPLSERPKLSPLIVSGALGRAIPARFHLLTCIPSPSYTSGGRCQVLIGRGGRRQGCNLPRSRKQTTEREEKEEEGRERRREEGKRKGKSRERGGRASNLKLAAAAATAASQVVRQKHGRTEGTNGADAREMRAPHQINHSLS